MFGRSSDTRWETKCRTNWGDAMTGLGPHLRRHVDRAAQVEWKLLMRRGNLIVLIVACIVAFVYIIWIPSYETKYSATILTDFYSKLRLLETLQEQDLKNLCRDCDEYIPLPSQFLASKGMTTPFYGDGFCIRFCDTSQFTINGLSPPGDLVGVCGISFGDRQLSTEKGELSILMYSPTNGTYSPGDAIRGVWMHDSTHPLREWFPVPRNLEILKD